MNTTDITPVLTRLLSELTEGVTADGSAFVLNPGDAGLLGSLDRVSAEDASRAVDDGATVAAHAEHLRYGLSLMNRWAQEGGNPFADAKWGDAWMIYRVDAARWAEIRSGLAREVRSWLTALKTPRDAVEIEVTGMVASIAHLAYHLGAIRQITRLARGPREATTRADLDTSATNV